MITPTILKTMFSLTHANTKNIKLDSEFKNAISKEVTLKQNIKQSGQLEKIVLN